MAIRQIFSKSRCITNPVIIMNIGTELYFLRQKLYGRVEYLCPSNCVICLFQDQNRNITTMASHQDLLELSRQFETRAFVDVSSEREQLQNLNDDVMKTAEQLYHLAWVMRQQKLTLDQLILGDREANPRRVLQTSKQLGERQFRGWIQKFKLS